MITIEKLKIYKKYLGDGDGFVRTGRTSEKQLFDKNDWTYITTSEESIDQIAKGLTSTEFKNKILEDLNKNFDSAAFDEITKPIH